MEINVSERKVQPGTANIKAQYIIADHIRQLNLEFVTREDKNKVDRCNETGASIDEPPKKKLRGQNKNRPRDAKVPKSEKLCFKVGTEGSCPYGTNCTYSHDIDSYLAKKPADIGENCYLFDTFGRCPYGFSCRFGAKHIANGQNVCNEELWSKMKEKQTTLNVLPHDLQIALRKRKYNFKKSGDILKIIQDGRWKENFKSTSFPEEVCALSAVSQSDKEISLSEPASDQILNNVPELYSEKLQINEDPQDCLQKPLGPSSDADIIHFKTCEVKKVDFRDKLYLAPLTTICGAHPDVMTRCSQLLNEKTSVDFIDVNMGCPLDFIYKKGSGCGLMTRTKKLEDIIYGMSSVSDVPITLKMRTGIFENTKLAHNVIKKIHYLKDSISLLTIHGRSREQRYTKSADWDYIKLCSEASYPVPLFGNGDVLSYEDYNLHRKETNVQGIMIARGALIKPWIFTEIKEQRHWDISSSERFDFIKSYVNYGLEHWGSDSEGVEKTRRFLLEWLSFLYRYIPVGLLERVPQHINERPPPYFGRNDLETLMASPSCADWIKISEMLLGPVPENFTFLPKHKANAYS